jgi:flagellar protein FlaG
MRLQTLDSAAPPLKSEPGGISVLGSGNADVAPVNARSDGSTTQAAAPVQPPEPTPLQLHDAVNQANTSLQAVASSLQFEIDPDTKTTIVRLIDTSDNKVLRQVPSPEVLEIAKAIDKMQGNLIKQVA